MRYEEQVGKKCKVCNKGIIFYFRNKQKDTEIELVACTNPECKGHVALE